ncbi:CUE domain-containing protein [Actinophytocola glycyrrhizae]|uniref:CUE domain-containing protein n=1 Tax=Actinophytocola glycyrrhizae TaxID=2044873 RepID=A0ABV9S997_9PSEU
MTRTKLLAKIRQVFPGHDPEDVQRVLDEYAGPERLRVHLAILKLCDEDRRDSPRHYVDSACQDHRDVLAWAESPQQLRPDWFSLSVTERAKVAKADRQQYARWLAR